MLKSHIDSWPPELTFLWPQSLGTRWGEGSLLTLHPWHGVVWVFPHIDISMTISSFIFWKKERERADHICILKNNWGNVDCRKKEVGIKFGTRPVQAVLLQPLGDERARGGIPGIYTPLYMHSWLTVRTPLYIYTLDWKYTHTHTHSVSVSLLIVSLPLYMHSWLTVASQPAYHGSEAVGLTVSGTVSEKRHHRDTQLGDFLLQIESDGEYRLHIDTFYCQYLELIVVFSAQQDPPYIAVLCQNNIS